MNNSRPLNIRLVCERETKSLEFAKCIGTIVLSKSPGILVENLSKVSLNLLLLLFAIR